MNRLFLGFDANHRKIYLSPEERKTHMYIIGSSGSGKSKFLEWMIRQDIKNGQGFCLIDPHGTLYEDIVKWCAYHYLIDKNIILFNPSAGDIIGFNPFKKSEGDISVQVDYQITATIRAWGLENTDETPTLERWLRCIYYTLIEKNLTITAIGYLLGYFEKEIREALTRDLSKKLIQDEWKTLSLKTERQFQDEILSTKNKLFRFLCSDQIERIMGLRKPILDIQEIMEEGKILLVNLAENENLSNYNARLIGALLVNEFFQQAKRRERKGFETPKPFYLYIDEFQNFVTPDIAYIMDQARKFGLFLVLAHQRLGHITGKEDDIIDAVLTNAKIKAVFGGLRRESAQMMVKEMFVNQLDLKEIKKAIYQTKFWPVYSRDKVYSSSYSSTTGHSSFSTTSLGNTTQGGEGWFFNPPISTTESSFEGHGSGSMEAESFGEAEIDIPIFIPVPFQELTSQEYWSLEEQIWRMSDALKDQFPRHCFIKILNRKTQPLLIPLVREYYLFEESFLQYQKEMYKKINALPKESVDKLLGEERKLLEGLKEQIEDTQETKAEICFRQKS